MTDSILANSEKRRGRATRGIELASHKGASTQVPLAPAPLPSELIVPLEGGLSARDLRPAVESGQRVLRGQPLVQGGGPLSTWTHASTSGVVRSLERRRIAHPRRREALCAVIEVDGKDDRWPELARPDPTQWDTPEKLAAALSRAGLAGLAGAVFPTGLKLAAAWRRRMRLVIVNGVECEPYISCDDMLMRTSPRDVLAGALVLVELAGADRGVVAVEDNKPEALQALQRALPMLDTQQRLSVVTVPTMYPVGGERQLIQALTGEEVPSLAKPTDVGYLCQNVGTAAALFRYLERGEPVTSRVTTVTGGAIATPRNLEVRLGTRITDLVAACGGYTGKVARLIMGGSMMGHALDNDLMPVGRPTNCIVAATAQELREDSAALACIRCGNCSNVCPAYLLPQELNAAAEHNEFDVLETLGLFDCIECGCCDVVCPSHIPLTETFRVGKRSLVQAMEPNARVRWLDAREQLRRQRVETWDREHGESAGEDRRPRRTRLEAVAEIIVRASRSPETTATSRGRGRMHSIRDILREKGATVRSIDPDVTVFDALKQMADHGIGALLVLQNGKAVGLFSERDYARKLALRGLRSRETPVSAVMSSPVLTISPDASVQEGLQVMTEKYVRHLPVVDGSGVLGMVSIGDLVKAVIQDQQALIEQLESYLAR